MIYGAVAVIFLAEGFSPLRAFVATVLVATIAELVIAFTRAIADVVEIMKESEK